MDVDAIIKRRLEEFEELGRKGETVFDFSPFIDLRLKATLMTELAFCISTANSSALAGLRFQKSLERLNPKDLSVEDFERLLRSAGVRFAKRKAEYVFKALQNFRIVEKALKLKSSEGRTFLVKNIGGLGYKEASHFLRNVGRKDVAIVDRHILRWLKENGYLEEIPKSVSARSYEKIERTLKKIAKEEDKSLAELDLVLWFEMTGKVLK